MNLRDYQLSVLDQLDAAIAEGQRKLLLVAPTGSGKNCHCRRVHSPRYRQAQTSTVSRPST